MKVVYTEIFGENGIERWYYGTYEANRANEVALSLGGKFPCFHCVCDLEDAEAFGIKNMP